MNEEAAIKHLLGVTLEKITGNMRDEIVFCCDDGREWRMNHNADCCETVCVEDVCGDIKDLIGSPITMAAEIIHPRDETPKGVEPPENPDSYTWTFYKLATKKGYVTIRWLGESNGWYSEGVDFNLIKQRKVDTV